MVIQPAGSVGRQCLPQTRERGSGKGDFLRLQACELVRRSGHKDSTRDRVKLRLKTCKSRDKGRPVRRCQLQWTKLRALPTLLVGRWGGVSGDSGKEVLISERIRDLFGIFGAVDEDGKTSRRRPRNGHNVNVLGTEDPATQD